MYHQSYTPFAETSEDGHFCLRVDFKKIFVRWMNEDIPRKQPIFSLEDKAAGQVRWVREGNWRLEDPHELFVSDDGWSVIRLHGNGGGQYARLLVVSPDGHDMLTVGVSSFIKTNVTAPPIAAGKWDVWIDEHVEHSTAGDFWSHRARFRFVSHSAGLFFVCRTHWGRYLILNLSRAVLLKEADPSYHAFSASLRSEDDKWAIAILEKACQKRIALEEAIRARQNDEDCVVADDLAELLRSFYIALLIVRQDGIRCAKDYLVALQSISLPGPSGTTYFAPEMGYGMYFQDDTRKLIHLAMLAIGAKPKGYAIIIFNFVGDMPWRDAPLLRLPECVPNRESLIRSLVQSMTPHEVAFKIGAPEYIRDTWHDRETCPSQDEFYFECWDYDEPDHDGTPATWALLWRRAQTPKEKNLKNLSAAEFDKSLTLDREKRKDSRTSEDDSPSGELVSITRFIWSDAYRMMREENIPIRLARERLAAKQPRPANG